MIKLSICIPTFNRGKYLTNLLPKLVDLNIPDYEIIIVDNKSTDDTVKIFKGFTYKDVKFFQNDRNIGMVNNWNRCIELASGDYIILIHADDLVDPKLFTEYYKILIKYPNIGLIFSFPYLIDENDQIIGQKKILKGNLVIEGAYLFKILLMTNFIYASGVLIKKDCYRKAGVFCEKYNLLPDFDMWLRILLITPAIYLDKPLFSYRIHPENIFSKIDQKTAFKEYLAILIRLHRTLDSEKKSEKILKETIDFLYRFKIWNNIGQNLWQKDSKQNFKKIININLKLWMKIGFNFLQTIIRRPKFFETINNLKTYHPAIWQFSILFKYFKFYFISLIKKKKLIYAFELFKKRLI